MQNLTPHKPPAPEPAIPSSDSFYTDDSLGLLQQRFQELRHEQKARQARQWTEADSQIPAPPQWQRALKSLLPAKA